VIRGNQVPGGSSKQKVACPLLNHAGSYVAFNGNGYRRGLGYRIVGYKGTGWLSKCGYLVSKNKKVLRATIRRFLADLKVVAGILGLTVVGFHSRDRRWVDFQALVAMARINGGIDQIEELSVRIYGPPDYHDRLRRYLEQQGRMRIPSPNGTAESALTEDLHRPNQDFRMRMQRLRMSQAELARTLGCSQPFLSKVFACDRPWPDGMFEQAEGRVAEAEARQERA
jgi:hypothetical protein